jgi:WD40 repeat protein
VGHTAEILSIRLSPDQSKLASGGFDYTVRIWDASTGELLQTLDQPSNWTFGVSWSDDGSKIAAASVDHKVRIWDVASEQLLATLVGHVGYVYQTDWLPDDSVASSSEDVTIRLWSPR